MGGDGTLAGLVKSILIQSPLVEANLHMFAFAPLPFGTGNDLSRSTGWGPIHGASPFLQNMDSLLKAVCSEKYDKLTLWDVNVEG
jgi:diacylglycerol kinase family enzyme